MNFEYSYRAFLITSLLTGCLVLFLFSIKLKGEQQEKAVESVAITMEPEDLLPEDAELVALTPDKVKIETNRAYNEAEKIISEAENDNQDLTETTEGKLQEMNDAIAASQSGSNTNSTSKTTNSEKEKKTKFSNSDSKKNDVSVVNSGNRNTTISYRLVNRTDMDLPNPVYTCYGSGKIVISIEVDQTGRVTKTSYSKSASTTANDCLIEAALKYASLARFTTEASKPKQLGTITFNFPGQQ